MPNLPTPPASRRDFLAASAALLAAGSLDRRAAAVPPAGPDGSLVVAHLTDAHVQPELQAQEGLAACLEHVHGLPRRPDLILGGGDMVMDVMANDRSRATLQKACFDAAFRDCRIPVRHCVGNHDIFGWNKEKSGTDGTEADWGKKWALDLFGLERAAYSFDHGGWHFIALDGVQPNGDNGYLARLDDAQREWLAADLAAVPAGRPVLVWTHIPVVTVTGFTADRNAGRTGETVISRGEMHADAPAVHRLLAESGKVRLCLSGHMHLLDRVEVDGVTYICGGAVSGGWWRGPHEPKETAARCPSGYGLVTLRPDGSFTHEYRSYGWKA
jgi:predicted MPP superfamily phosphohydrolase